MTKAILVSALAWGLAAAASLAGAAGAQAQGRFVYCARENGVCDVPYPTQVKYGAEGQFTARNVGGPVRCDNRTFGDPAYGAVKSCFYLARRAAPRYQPDHQQDDEPRYERRRRYERDRPGYEEDRQAPEPFRPFFEPRF